MSGNLKALLVGGPMYDPYQQIPNYFSQRKGRGKMPRWIQPVSATVCASVAVGVL
jgi:hypothetical protein